MRIRVLGPLSVSSDGPTLAPRDRVVLAALIVQGGGTVGAETLADALWFDDEPPASWTKVVQGCIVRIRKVLGTNAVETDGRGYRLVVSPDEIDARRFERAVARCRELLALGEPDRAMYAADEALSLWTGHPLPELEEWEPGRIEAARLVELRLDAEELRIEAALRAGRHREVLADASAAVARAPVREHRWALLALAQHQAGRQGDALRSLHEARRMLVRELGVDPGDEIVALEAAILRQDPSLVAPALVRPSDVCPFRGLSAYEAADADLYFGRAGEIGECLERLRTAGVLTIVGPSGSGKSSLLRAGLTPALERDGHRVDVITPGAHPMRALDAIALPRAGAHVALVVDQCEEAVTLCADVEERRRFFDALVGRAARGQLLVGFRADRLGELTEHAAFAALVERGLYLLTPMSSAQLREAIEAPARQAGLLLESGLVDLLLRDAEDEPGSLPLLSHALYQTWLNREGNALTVAGYRAAGGIRGAVAQSAEHLYEQVPAEHRPMLRNLVLRLVAPSTDGEPVRARVPRRIVAPDPERQQLLDDLVAARLVTTDAEADGASVELAHEALVRAWPRLREWLDDDAEGQRVWRHLAAAAETWDAMGRPTSELYRGVRLARTVEWSEQTGADLHPIERDFLDASTALDADERAAREAEAERHARSNRRLRVLVGAATVLALIAVAGAVVAKREADRADAQTGVARSHELASAAIGAVDDDPALAKSLAVAAADAAPDGSTAPVVAALHRALDADPTVGRWGFVGEVGYTTAAIDPAGTRIAAAGMFHPDGAGWTLSVADIEAGATLWSADLSAPGRASVALAEPLFADDGEHVVVGVYWDPASWRRPPVAFEGVDEPPPGLLGAQIRDAATGELIEAFDLGRCGGVVSAVSETHLVARTLHGDPDVLRDCRWRDGTIGIELVERSSAERTVLTTATGQPWHLGAAMSADGRVVAYDTVGAPTDGSEGEVVILDLATDIEIARLSTQGVRDLDAAGRLLLAGWHEVSVWDIETREPITTVDVARGGRNADSRFAPDGRAVVSSSDDGSVRTWDARTGAILATFPGVGSGPVHTSESGRVTVSTPDQQIVTTIDLEERGELGAVDLCTGEIGEGSLSVADGRAFVTADCGGSSATFVIDVADDRVTRHDGPRLLGSLASAPDGSAFVAQRLDATDAGPPEPGPLVVHSSAIPSRDLPLAPLPGSDPWPVADRLRWSPDGRWIVAAMRQHVAVWDATDGTLVQTTTDDAARTVDVIFTPDSTAIITSSDDRTLTLRSLADWDEPLTRATTIDGADRIGLVGFTDGGASLVAIGAFRFGGSSLARFDASSLAAEMVWPAITESAIVAASTDHDGGRVATAANDGTVRVWDTATGELVHDVGRRLLPANNVAFAGSSELIIGVPGRLERITIDPVRLIELARSSLSRGFSDSECATFNFGGDCPTLDHLRRRPSDEGAPRGDFRITWTAGELEQALVATVEAYFDAPLWNDPGVTGFVRDLAADLAGTYELRLRSGAFELWRDGLERPICAGSVRYESPRLSLLAERGSLCYPSVLFESDITVDDELRLHPATIRAEFPAAVAFGTRPLERTG